MKFLKYSFLALLLAIVTDAGLVFAYDAPMAQGISMDLVRNTPQWGPWKTKNTWTWQRYENLSASTWLTNPCNSCQIVSKLFDKDGNTDLGSVSTPGHTVTLNTNTMFGQPSDYHLSIWRADTTLLTTHHTAMWVINP